MTLKEFLDREYYIDKEYRYYSTVVADGHASLKDVDNYKYWKALYDKKEKWKINILENAVKTLDKSYLQVI